MESAAKTATTPKPTDGPIYGMVFETADPHFDKQINTHFTAISAYLEKQVCFNNYSKIKLFFNYFI